MLAADVGRISKGLPIHQRGMVPDGGRFAQKTPNMRRVTLGMLAKRLNGLILVCARKIQQFR